MARRKASTPVLWQFRYSHFNEKARWALDFKGVRHVRRSIVPGFHLLPMYWLTGQSAVPVLQVDGTTVADSTKIIAALEERYPDPPLYPRHARQRDRALALEEYFDEHLGPQLRLAWFFEMLPATDFAAAQLTAGADALTQRSFRLVFPVVREAMKLKMGLNAESARAARDEVVAAVDRLEAEIQPSGYLVGDQFSVADLTAASLLAPVVMPREFPYPLLRDLPDGAARYRASLMRRPAMRWAAEIYHKHRGRSHEVAAAP